MAPFVHLKIDFEGMQALWPLGDDDLGAALIEFLDDPVGVERLIGEQGIERDPVDKRFDTDCVVAISGQQNEAHEVAERVGKREDFGRPAALGLAYGLALSPPFAPWP